jgi:hypothetical protein
MGKADADEWHKKMVINCPCIYCIGRFSSCWSWDGVRLPNGEVQYYDGNDPKNYWIGKPGCIKQTGASPTNPFPSSARSGPVREQKFTVTGCVCKNCNSSNECALPNRPDGSYVCYNCR